MTKMSSSIPLRKIGNTDVAAIGFGAMGISMGYGSVGDDEERLKVSAVLFYDVHTFGCNYLARFSTLHLNLAAHSGTLPTSMGIQKSLSENGTFREHQHPPYFC